MLAVVEIAGVQFEVSSKQQLNVPHLSGNEGDTVVFTNILATVDKDDTTVGTPYLKGKVTAKIVGHGKAEKILVFHKKRRKGMRRLKGHKTQFTTVEITDIIVN